jgi:hypothetical protein
VEIFLIILVVAIVPWWAIGPIKQRKVQHVRNGKDKIVVDVVVDDHTGRVPDGWGRVSGGPVPAGAAADWSVVPHGAGCGCCQHRPIFSLSSGRQSSSSVKSDERLIPSSYSSSSSSKLTTPEVSKCVPGIASLSTSAGFGTFFLDNSRRADGAGGLGVPWARFSVLVGR